MSLVYRVTGTALLLLMAAASASAQELQAGAKVGAALSSLSNVYVVTNDDNDASGVYTGPAIGAFVAYALTERLSIQPEVFYVTKGAALDDDAEGNSRSVMLKYLEIPVLLKLSAPPGDRMGLYAFAGGTVGLKLDATLREGDDDEDLGEDISRTDVGATFGLGIEGGRWLVEGRFTQGLLDIGNEDDRTVKTRSVAVLAGVRF